MIAVHVSAAVLWAFYWKRAVYFYAMPVLVGFLVAVLYPVGQRTAAKPGAPFLKVLLLASLGPAFMLAGWSMVGRTLWTPPMYGLGYGLGVALLSRVHKIFLWPPRLVLRLPVTRRPPLSVSGGANNG